MRWIEQYVVQLPTRLEPLLPVQIKDVLEVDEAWSFVVRKADKRWLWTVMCRRTRQIVAFVIGDHRADTCRRLWRQIPEVYRCCRSDSDFWKVYQQGFPLVTRWFIIEHNLRMRSSLTMMTTTENISGYNRCDYSRIKNGWKR